MLASLLAIIRHALAWRHMRRCGEHRHAWERVKDPNRVCVMIERCRHCGVHFATYLATRIGPDIHDD
jgi:hypothetical protein